MSRHRILKLSDLPAGSAQRVEIDGRVIAVFNVGGEILAIDDTCTHEAAPLSEGTVCEGRVVCPWHGAEFDLRTGEAVTPPASENVRAYAVSVSDGEVFVEF